MGLVIPILPCPYEGQRVNLFIKLLRHYTFKIINCHNFSFSRKEYVESIELLQNILQVGLWDARFDRFEFGAIFPVDKSPSQYIKNHTAGKRSKLNENWKGNNRGKGKWWDNPNEILKMYDAGANIRMKQKRSSRGIIEEDGYNPNLNYLKFEAHFIKPFLLNFGRDIV